MNNFEVVSDDVQHLEIVSAELKTDSNQTLLFVSCYRPPDADQSWMDEFKNFLNYTSDKYKNVIVSGDLNLPNIPWNSIGNTTSAQELTFIELLNDHFLTQLITVPTRGKNTLDLVITSVPELVSVTEILPQTKLQSLQITVLPYMRFQPLSKLLQKSNELSTIMIKAPSWGCALL